MTRQAGEPVGARAIRGHQATGEARRQAFPRLRKGGFWGKDCSYRCDGHLFPPGEYDTVILRHRFSRVAKNFDLDNKLIQSASYMQTIRSVPWANWQW